MPFDRNRDSSLRASSLFGLCAFRLTSRPLREMALLARSKVRAKAQSKTKGAKKDETETPPVFAKGLSVPPRCGLITSDADPQETRSSDRDTPAFGIRRAGRIASRRSCGRRSARPV